MIIMVRKKVFQLFAPLLAAIQPWTGEFCLKETKDPAPPCCAMRADVGSLDVAATFGKHPGQQTWAHLHSQTCHTMILHGHCNT